MRTNVFLPKKNFRKIGLFVYYQIRYMQLTRWTIACVTIFGCNSLCSIVCKFKWHWKKVYKQRVRKLLKISSLKCGTKFKGFNLLGPFYVGISLRKCYTDEFDTSNWKYYNPFLLLSVVDHNQCDRFVDWNRTPPQWTIAFPLSKVLKMLTSYVS